MPVTNLKVQMEFRMGEAGWSEILYTNGSDPFGAKSAAISLCRERLKILVDTAQIHHVRISPANERTVRSYRFPLLNNVGLIHEARDVANTTVVVGIYGLNGEYRSYKVHGYPDERNAFRLDGGYGSGLGSALQGYFDYLAPGTADSIWQIKHRKKFARDDSNVKITDVVQVGTDIKFVMPTAGFAKDQKITVSGMGGYNVRQFNGNYRVKEVVAGPPAGLLVTPRFQVSPGFFYVGGSGAVRDNSGDGFIYANIRRHDDFCTGGTRKTGRPTDEHRGRVSGRR